MESGDRTGKKARANGMVKQEQPDHLGGGGGEEQEEGEVSQGSSSGAGAVVEVASMVEPQINVTIGVALFHCQACLLPLKPPTFKCEGGGHVVCSGCRVRHGQACASAAAYAHCNELDAIVGAAKVPCAHEPYGCKALVVYHEASDHQSACPCAPCSCPEFGCVFFGSPAMLVYHFAADHSWPVTEFPYAKPRRIAVPPRRRAHVLVEEQDRSVFLVSPCALGAATAVCVVRLGANRAPQFKCKLLVEPVSNHSESMVMMTSMVGSSDMSGGFSAAEQGMFLAVPPELLQEVSGQTPMLSVRLDKARCARN